MLRIKSAVTTHMPIVELMEFKSSLLPPEQTAPGMTTVVITATYAVPALSIMQDEIQA